MDFDISTALLTEWNDKGFLGIQIDVFGQGGSAATEHEEHQYGFMGRPCDPEEDGRGCYVLVGKEGHEQRCWFAHDPRTNEWLPRITKGGSAQYGGTIGRALTWREIDGETGTIKDYVPVEWDGNGVATKAHEVEIGVDGSPTPKPSLKFVHSDGMALVLYDGSATLADATGTGFFSAKDGKCSVSGPLKATSGLDVGGTGGVEVPLHPLLAGAFEIYSGTMAGLLGTLSTAAGNSIDPALKAAIPTFCGAMITALETLSAAVTAGKSTMFKTL